MAQEVGSGQVAIYPTFKGFRRKVTDEVDGSTKEAGSRFTRGFRKVGTTAGSDVGTGFRKAFGDATKNVSAQAVSKIKADVASAAKAVSAARLKEQDAAGKVRVAEAQLAEARKRYSSDSSQVVRAQERLASSTRSLGSAEDVAKAATDRLKAAQDQLKSATSSAQQSVSRSGSGFRNAFSGIGDVFGSGGRSAGSGFLSGIGGALTVGAIGGVLAGAATGVLGVVKGVVDSAVDAIVNGARTAIVTAIDYNSTLENANIAFTTMLRSGDKAKSFLDDLQAFARETPFEFPSLITASQRLLAMGVAAKDVIPYLRGIGDAAAASGRGAEVIDQITNAIGQMTAKGKVQGDEILQLTEAGIPALKILADAYGTTTAGISDMISKGKVLSSTAVPAIIEGLEKGTKTTAGFGGMMEKQSQTFSGALSNINDTVQQSLGTALQPLFKVVEQIAVQVAAFAGSTAFQTWISGIASTVGSFFNEETLANVQSFFTAIFGGDTATASDGLLATLGPAFTQIKDAVVQAMPFIIAFAQQVLPILIEGFTQTITRTAGLIGFLGDISPVLAPLGGIIAVVGGFFIGFAGTLYDVLGAVGSFVHGAIGFFSDFKNSVSVKLGEAAGFVATFPSKAIAALGDLGSKLFRSGSALIQGFIDGIKSKVKPLTDAVGFIMREAGKFFPRSPAKRGEFSGRGWTVYSGQATAEGFADGMENRTSTIRSAAGAVMGAAALTGSARYTGSSAGGAGGDRPIYMDGNLFGILRQLANGEATIVLNAQNAALNTGSRLGTQGLTFG